MRFSRFRSLLTVIVAAVLALGVTRLVLQAQSSESPVLVVHSDLSGIGFGVAARGVASAPTAITLQNISDTTTISVQAGTLPLAPLTYNDFAVASSNCATLAPKAFCTVAVTFTPGGNGPRIGRLQLQTASAPAMLIPLVGQGVDAAVAQPVAGPIDARTGFPLYFTDGLVALELCLDHTPPVDAVGNPVPQIPDPALGLTPTLCLGPVPDPARAPAVTDDPATTNFGAEAFWWSAEAAPAPIAGSPESGLLLVLAQEAAFATEAAKTGDQWTFGRLRFRVDNAVPFARYRFTHPFGVDIHEAADTRLFATEDNGCFTTPCDYTLALPGRTRILSFLRCVSPAPPPGYLGDPNQLCAITGSPFITNFFRVERETAPGAWTLVGETNQFSVSGKMTTVIPPPPPTNQAPNAVDDIAATPYNTPVIISVLNNDTDPNAGNVISILTVTNGANGTAVVNGRTITYTPSAVFTAGGVDTFQYAISDNAGLTDTATVRVTVAAAAPPNRPPVAVNDTFALVPDIIFPEMFLFVAPPGVLENDTDPDGDPLTVELVAGPSANPLAPDFPLLSLSPDGMVLFDYGVGIAQNTPVTFTYRVSDGQAFSAPATVTISMARPAGQPVAVNDALTTLRDTPVTADVDANDNDGGDPGDVLQQDEFSLLIRRLPANGSVRTLNVLGNQVIEYTPNPGFVGVDTFTYTTYDFLFHSNVATVTVTVTAPAPVLVQVPNVVSQLRGAAEAAIINANLTVGAITTQVNAAPVNTVIAQSPAGGTSAATGTPVALTISLGPPVNRAPVAGNDTLAAAGPLTFTAATLLANDSDPDGQVLSVSAMSTVGTAGGTIVAANATSWIYTPPAGFTGVDTFTYTVSDGAATASGTVSVTVTIPGLVLALSFNETSGTVAADGSGGGRNGTITGAVFAAGRFGNALSFDGVNDWVTVADAAALDLTTGLTLEAWVRPTVMSGWETVMLKERGTGAMSYSLYAHDGAPLPGGTAAPAGAMNVGGTADPAIRGTSPLPLNAWTHVAVTYDGARQRIYVNGVQVASRAQTGTITPSASPLRIGGNAAWAGEFFQGLIDEVRVYNRALSAAEVQANMNAPIR